MTTEPATKYEVRLRNKITGAYTWQTVRLRQVGVPEVVLAATRQAVQGFNLRTQWTGLTADVYDFQVIRTVEVLDWPKRPLDADEQLAACDYIESLLRDIAFQPIVVAYRNTPEHGPVIYASIKRHVYNEAQLDTLSQLRKHEVKLIHADVGMHLTGFTMKLPQ